MQEAESESTSVSRQPVAVDVQPRWIAPASLAVAAVALGVAVWALVAPPGRSAPASPAPTSQQVADAKSRACTAFTTVGTAVKLQTHTELGSDPVAVTSVTAVSRLAMSSGATYLLAHLDPATPPDLAAAIRAFAADLQDISMYGQAGIGASDPVQADRLKAGQDDSVKIGNLCK
ncbi:hypothetical protein [Mycolicibacterium sp. CBMA 234]|uniref:hypothetical protein n=1 Tax=Mycolicibacterium sp. CBMA 234 TaxID=1918495 RepID=UPI0012DBCD19|nr:hypothetical protein [Mycolicibacterium sp. CBMA 234]